MSDPIPEAAVNNMPSLSQCLAELGRDVLPQQAADREYAALLRIVITAWNLAVAPGNAKVTRGFDDALLHTTPEIRQQTEVLLADLVARKNKLFPKDTRVVFEARIRRTDTGITIETRSYDFAAFGDKYL